MTETRDLDAGPRRLQRVDPVVDDVTALHVHVYENWREASAVVAVLPPANRASSNDVTVPRNGSARACTFRTEFTLVSSSYSRNFSHNVTLRTNSPLPEVVFDRFVRFVEHLQVFWISKHDVRLQRNNKCVQKSHEEIIPSARV